MDIFSGVNALKLYFVIAPALYFVNMLIAASFAYKYRVDSIYKKNTAVWFFYLLLGVSQGALQESGLITRTLLWSVFVFFASESVSLFASDLFKMKSKIKSDLYFFIFGFLSTCILFYTTDNFFISTLPSVFFAAYPVLRLAPLIQFFKNNSFTKNGYLLTAIAIALHGVDYAYAADKPDLMFPGYVLALMLATGLSCFSFAVLIERAIMDVEIKDLLHSTSRLTALGGMAAEIAHEIRNPLSVLALSNAQLKLKSDEGLIDEGYLKNKIDVIDRMIKRLTSIMDTLKLNYQSGESDDYKAVSLKNIFEQARILCEVSTNKFEVDLFFDENLTDTMILCRSVQITQVLQNLVQNAVDVLEGREERWIKIGLQIKDRSIIEISVADSGPGIPEEFKGKIFNSFFTTKTNGKGTGLGLSISKRFVEEHDGYLRLDEASENTKFIIGLPIIKT